MIYVAALHDIRETPLRPQRQKHVPKRLDDTIVMETTGTRNTVDNTHTHNSVNLKVCLYYSITGYYDFRTSKKI